MSEFRLTHEEKEAVISELAERMKDLVYMNARRQAEKVLNKILTTSPKPDQVFEVEYKFRFVFNDIIQILGRFRRSREEGGDE